MYRRTLITELSEQLGRKKSVLLMGPRQVGKTTICHQFKNHLELNLASYSERIKFEKDPGLLGKLVNNLRKGSLVYVDEIQKVPSLFSEIQVLTDQKQAQFLLTGSSSRKIKQQTSFNLAPGRLVNLRLDPLSIEEHFIDFEDVLEFGQLPGIVSERHREQRELDLRSYVENYLEEEIRKETRLRQIAPFARFLELAAIQSGRISNFSEISKELGPTVATVQNYFQILEDTLVVDRVDPYLKNQQRKKLTKSSRYLFFDMGVRRILSGESHQVHPDRKGELFEHFIGNEILKWIRSSARSAKLHFWRDSDGPEVDWLIDYEGALLPIEVKLSRSPTEADAKNLMTFMKEYKKARQSLIVCNTETSYSLNKQVKVISYRELHSYLTRWLKFG